MEDLNVFTSTHSLQNWLRTERSNSKVCLVATMGALHEGHLSLIKKAFSVADIVVVSIFVNPAQFNKKEDLINYPRNLKEDLEILKKTGNVIVFAPEIDDMYPQGLEALNLDLGLLEVVLEGKYRPGHFNGVMNIMNRLFKLIEPDYAIFGLKDYQQFVVINKMLEVLNLNIQIVGCETVRNLDGLALSSRNKRLNSIQKRDALIIYRTMLHAQSLVSSNPPSEVKSQAITFFNEGNLELEYLEIVDPSSFEVLENWVPGARICIAAKCGNIRLIDNLDLA